MHGIAIKVRKTATAFLFWVLVFGLDDLHSNFADFGYIGRNGY